MQYELSDRRIINQLRVLAEIGTVIPSEHKEGIRVNGRVYKAKTIRRYADRVVEFCKRNGMEDCPVRKEYLVNGSGNVKRVKIIIDREKAEELLKMLREEEQGADMEEDQPARGELEGQLQLELEEIKEKLNRIEEAINNLTPKGKAGEGLADIVRSLVNWESEDYMRCVKDFVDGREVDDWCKLLLIVIDKATDIVEKNMAPTTLYVNYYKKNEDEANEKLSVFKRILREKVKNAEC